MARSPCLLRNSRRETSSTRVATRTMRPFLVPILFVLFFSGAATRGQTPDRELRGQLLNAAGQPVASAAIQVRAVSRLSGTRYGESGDVQASTTTDAKGEF